MRVGWKSIAPIFADVAISPWNLLVGGVLIQQLSFTTAVLSVGIGYTILALIFILYGGLGFKERKESSQLLTQVFGSKIVKYPIPLILAFGQIGWAAINIDLGGRSLGVLLSLPAFLAVAVYAVLLLIAALLNLSRIGILKWITSFASLALMGYLFFVTMHGDNMTRLLHYQPMHENSLFWGVSIVVASFISFATITPDFFKSVRTKNDVLLSSISGLLPGVIVALLGCFLFFDKTSLDLIPLLSLTAFPLFPHIFNTITNTDGSTAIYTPGLKLKHILPISFKQGIIIAGGISFLLGLTQISLHIALWLNILSIIFPILISVCFSAILFKRLTTRTFRHYEAAGSFVFSFVLACIIVAFFPPVLISLLAPILFFVFSIGYTKLSVL